MGQKPKTNQLWIMVRFEKDGNGMLAHAPGLLGCHTWAPTQEEARTKMKDLLEHFLSTMSEYEIDIPLGRWVRASPPPKADASPPQSKADQDWTKIPAYA